MIACSNCGNKFLRFVNNVDRLVTIQAVGASTVPGAVAATDPDIYVIHRGQWVAVGLSAIPGQETIPQFPLPAGTYVIDVNDYAVSGTNTPPRCMTVSIQG